MRMTVKLITRIIELEVGESKIKALFHEEKKLVSPSVYFNLN